MQVVNQYNSVDKNKQHADLLPYIYYTVHMVMDCMVLVLVLQ